MPHLWVGGGLEDRKTRWCKKNNVYTKLLKQWSGLGASMALSIKMDSNHWVPKSGLDTLGRKSMIDFVSSDLQLCVFDTRVKRGVELSTDFHLLWSWIPWWRWMNRLISSKWISESVLIASQFTVRRVFNIHVRKPRSRCRGRLKMSEGLALQAAFSSGSWKDKAFSGRNPGRRQRSTNGGFQRNFGKPFGSSREESSFLLVLPIEQAVRWWPQ